MRLAHLQLPGLTSYHHAAKIQEALIQRHFLSRDLLRAANRPGASDSPSTPPPDPAVITTELRPVYTFGRRQLNTVSQEQRRFLQDDGRAMVVEAQRGGQLTYHGPGQLVAYPVVDLRAHKLTPRNYIRLLEGTVMAVCSSFAVPDVETTEDAGVWIKGGQRKVCAVGVQVRRGVTAHGIGLNVVDRGQSLSWGFSRIVACGLEGKQVTWLSKESPRDCDRIDVEAVASEFVKTLATRLGHIEEIYKIHEQDVRMPREELDTA
jgi:lipoyl(octanoyl) transferase 2